VGRLDEPGAQPERLSMQLRILRFGLFEDGNIGIGVFPEDKEILIRGSRPGVFSRDCVCPAQLQVRQYTDGIADHDSTVRQAT
jgi:hypothetical protein